MKICVLDTACNMVFANNLKRFFKSIDVDVVATTEPSSGVQVFFVSAKNIQEGTTKPSTLKKQYGSENCLVITMSCSEAVLKNVMENKGEDIDFAVSKDALKRFFATDMTLKPTIVGRNLLISLPDLVKK